MEEKTKNGTGDLLAVVSVFHYVVGGFQLLTSLLGFFYIAMGILMGSGALDSGKSAPPPAAMGWIFGGIGVVVALLFILLGSLSIKAGTCIRRRKKRMFCITVDAILCLLVPFGTIVGIFGLIMLTRPETIEEFTG